VLLLKFVQLAVKFREYNNFSSSMCILAALVSSPVRRLKATWAEVPQEWLEKMSALETLFAHNMSYKTYRETVLRIVPPCIPYLGLYLTDLTFIEGASACVAVRLGLIRTPQRRTPTR
jgi:son of sevenless-like protein